MKTYLLLAVLASALAPTLCLRADPPNTRGPVQVAGLQPKVTPDGVEAPGYRWTPFATDPDHWTAEWVTAPAPTNGATNVTGSLLRGECLLPDRPSRAEARIAASASYLLFLNGIPVSRGPADQGKDFAGRGAQRTPFYDLRDLTPFLHAGTNTVAVLTDPGAKVVFEARCTLADGKCVTLGSDAGWRGMPAWFLTKVSLPPGEGNKARECAAFDAAAEPIGWSAPGCDDSGWSRVAPPVPVAKGELQASELPPCMEVIYPVKTVVAVVGSPIAVPSGALSGGKPLLVSTNGAVDVIFDRVMSARVGFKIRGTEGTEISFTPSELPGKGKTPAGILRLRDGIQTFETRRFHAVGAIRLDFRNVAKPVEILEVTADWTSQPVAYEGSFECSDPFLNRLWKVCRTSVEINLQTHHLDSPTHQEPISDYGDYLIEDLVAYDAFGYGNPWLIRQDLRKWAAVMRDAGYHTFHTSYTLLWLQALMNYYEWTGDAALVKELAPTVRGLLAKFEGYLGPEGLVSQAPDYMFMDWVTIGGLPAHHPPAEIGMGFMTALYYQALSDGIRVAEITGDPKEAAHYRALREKIREGYQSRLWDETAGLYRDGVPHLSKVEPHKWMPADFGIVTHTPQNNAMAVAYGLAKGKKAGKVMERTLAIKPWNLQPYFMHFVFDAMERSGVFEKEANARLREWTIREETQSLLEANGMGDLSHAWAATPLYQMSSRILGVEPAAPGFTKILLKPRLGDLQWAKGTVPTPHGPVTVSWAREGTHLRFEVDLPEGTETTLDLPKPLRGSEVLIDGLSTKGDLTSHRLLLALKPGKHTVQSDREDAKESPASKTIP